MGIIVIKIIWISHSYYKIHWILWTRMLPRCNHIRVKTSLQWTTQLGDTLWSWWSTYSLNSGLSLPWNLWWRDTFHVWTLEDRFHCTIPCVLTVAEWRILRSTLCRTEQRFFLGVDFSAANALWWTTFRSTST